MNARSRAARYLLRAAGRKWGFSLLTGALACVMAFGAAGYFVRGDNRDRLELSRLRHYFDLRGPRPPPDNLVIVGIDETAVTKLAHGARVFPRNQSALAMKRLMEAAPKVAILDLRIPREDVDEAANQMMVEALRRGPTVIVRSDDGERSYCGNKIQFAPTSSDPRFLEASTLQIPMWTVETAGEHAKISLCDSSVPLADRVPLSRPLSELAHFSLEEPGEDDFINFYGPPGTIPKVSLYTVVTASPETLRSFFHNKVVFVGYLYDENRGMNNNEAFVVPVSGGKMFGVEIHSSIASNLLDRSWLRRFTPQTDWAIIFLTILFISGIGLKLRPERGVPFLLGSMIIAYLAGYLAFLWGWVWLPGITLICQMSAATLLVTLVLHYKHISARLRAHTEAFRTRRAS